MNHFHGEDMGGLPDETRLPISVQKKRIHDADLETTETGEVQKSVDPDSMTPVATEEDPSLYFQETGYGNTQSADGLLDSGGPVVPKEIRLLGQGGMGEVWGAHQPALLREVAVKVPRSDVLEMLEPQQQEVVRGAFLREARVSALLEHPAMVPVHDLIQPESNRPRLVMRKVDGVTWESALRKDEEEHQPLADFLSRHIPILIMVSQAVAYAHSRGVIHRDLKPSQVMLGAYGEVLLLDWGLALRVGDGPTHPALLGLPKAATWKSLEGTPAYLAPEQAAPDRYPLGTHTDIYQLGGILCRVLTGEAPHSRMNLRADVLDTSDTAWRTRLRSKTRLPEELISLVEDCLQNDPALRPESAREVARRLEEWQGGRARRQQARALLQEARERLNSLGEDYDQFNSVVSQLEQSRSLWPDQPDFPEVWDTMMGRFARLAIVREDLEFAATLAGRIGDSKKQNEIRASVLVAQKDRREREAQRRRLRWIAVVATVLAMLCLLALYAQARMEREKEAANQRLARVWLGTRALETAMNQQEDNLRVLADFMVVADSVTSEVFDRFALPITRRHPGLRSLNWVEEIPGDQRSAAELRYRAEDSRFPGIREPVTSEQWVPAQSRPVHRVVRFVAPYGPNAVAHGLDQNFSPERAATFDQARDTGRLVVSPRILLALGPRGEPGKLVVLPAYKSGWPVNTVEERRAALQGYSVGVWRLGDIMHSALHDRFPSQATFVLKDPTEPIPNIGSFRSSNESPDPNLQSDRVIRSVREFDFAGKRYIVESLEWR